ncbi:hypothetical protein ID0464_08450 [Helicobacter pylori]
MILLGYSLSDQNVKQIISWVNSHSKSVKPIYFIKTAKEFDRIEFEFYKNKNIHILYTQELFEKKGHYEELLSFLKEIKKDKPKDISKSYSGIVSSTKQLRKMILNFDYNAMKKRISEISLKSSSVLNELEKAFLLYHLGQGIQSFETLKINSKQAFRERNYDVWYISLYNMHNIPLFYGYSDENNKKIEKYHEERVSIDLNESFYELPFYTREQLKYLRDISTTLDTNLIEAYQLKEKALKDLEVWSSSDSSFSFNNNQIKAYGIFKKTLLKYLHFLIINENQKKFFQQMTEIFFSFMAIFQIQEKRRDNNKTIPITLKSEQIYCILKYFDNKILMQKLNQYFQETNIVFKVERDIDLIGIFKNIEICQEKIDEDLLWNSYDSMGYLITKQWNKFKMEIKTEIKFSILDRILFFFIRKLTENFSGYLIILESSPRCMQNLLFILQQYNIEYNIELDLIQQDLINTLIKEIMELPNDTQIFISNYLICDLFPITKNNDGVNQNVKKFLFSIWEKNQNRKTI